MILDSQWDIQKAIYSKLSENIDLVGLIGVDAVLDYVPKDKKYPFVTISDSKAIPVNTMLGNGLDIEVTINSYSDYQGAKEIKLVMGEIYKILEDVDFIIDNHEVVLCRFLRSEIKQIENIKHGTQKFQIITEVN